jgi:hypothetical protein
MDCEDIEMFLVAQNLLPDFKITIELNNCSKA